MLMNSGEYLKTLDEIKQEIKASQYRAAVHINADMTMLYYSIGTVINEHKTWGNKFIENLASDIRREFPDSKGYSVRNLKYMAKFAQTYPDREFVQTVSAQIPWSHNIAIMDKVKAPEARIRYIQKLLKMSESTRGPLRVLLALDKRSFAIYTKCSYRLQKLAGPVTGESLQGALFL